MLEILARAFAVEREAVSNDLHDLGAGALSELIGRLAAGEVAAILDSALDELVCLERLLGLLDDGIGDIGLADEDDGVEVVRQGAKLTDLLAGKSHACPLSNGVLNDSLNHIARGEAEQVICRVSYWFHERIWAGFCERRLE